MIIGGFWKIPEAIKTELEGEIFSLSPTWSRYTVFYFDDVDDTQLQAVVAPVTRTLTPGTRPSKAYDYRVGVFVMKQIHASTNALRQAEEDSLLTLVDEIQNKLNEISKVTIGGKNFSMSPPSDEQSPFIAEAYRTAKRFVSAAEVNVYDR